MRLKALLTRENEFNEKLLMEYRENEFNEKLLMEYIENASLAGGF